MLNPIDRARQTGHQDNLMAGAWKFLSAKTNPCYGVTVEQLTETAKELINAGIGKGRFIQLYVRGTGHDEIGLCFMYEFTQEEAEEDHGKCADWKSPYIDFFMRRHGVAYKGYDIGTGIDLVNLADSAEDHELERAEHAMAHGAHRR